MRRYVYGTEANPNLFLVHGLTDAGTCWPEAAAHWAEEWQVIAIDQRGHGRSPHFDTDGLSDMFTTFIDDLIGVLEEEGPGVVIGHSLGGRIAAATATRRPDLVTGLVLEDPALTDGPVTSPRLTRDQRRFLAAFDDADSAAEQVRVQETAGWSTVEIEAWAECKTRVDLRMIDRLDLGDLDAATAYNALTVPTLVLYDADGMLAVPREGIDNPLVQIEYLDGVGHCIRRDDPARFYDIVDRWLESKHSTDSPVTD